jgi:hypothetical protein
MNWALVEGKVGLIFLGFLIPLAVYLLILAFLNRTDHPVLIPGSWDCAGLLLASSGLLLLGGPAILTGLYEEWRLAWLLGQTRFLRGFGENWQFWIGVWIVYFLLVVAGAAWLLASRRRFTSVYNVDPAVLDETLGQALARLGLEWSRAGSKHRIIIRPRESDLENEPVQAIRQKEYLSVTQDRLRHGEREPATTQNSLSERVTLTMAPFTALRHVTLRWSGPRQGIRSEVEEELDRSFRNMFSNENPASRWFMSLSVSIFLVCFFALAGLVAVRFIRLLR